MTIPFWTRSGTIDLAALRPQDMTAGIIGDTLAKINRFGGRTDDPWSVAAHSVLVERLCPPDLGPWALLHDAHEFVFGDITTPAVDLIAWACNIPNFDDALALAKGKIDRAIGRAWCVVPRSLNLHLRRADRIALCAEAVMFLDGNVERLEPGDADDIDRAVSILMETPTLRDWRGARDIWLSRVEHYAALGKMTPPAIS